jgi:hypothetical protein
MNFVNRVKVERRTDHLLLRFGFSPSEDANDAGEETATLAVPMFLGFALLVELLEASVSAPLEIGDAFLRFQAQLADMQKLATESVEKGKLLQIRQNKFAVSQLQTQLAAARLLLAAQPQPPEQKK